MVYTPLTIRAMEIAYNAHHGQMDKAGIPYVFHPLHVAEGMDEEISCCVALLHDTVEDTDVTLEQLSEIFPPQVVEAVRLLTYDENTDYFDYVRAIKNNPIAKKVKLADIAHNSDQSRFAGVDISSEKLAYYCQKYEIALKILLDK